MSAGVHACDLLIDCLVVVAGRTIYDMCTQKAPHDYTSELYDRYKMVLDKYITDTVRATVS